MMHLSVGLTGTTHHAVTVHPSKKNLSVATQSFAEQKTQAFSETLSRVHAASSSVKREVVAPSSQINVARQNSVTDSIPSAAAAIGFNALIPTTVNAASTEEAVTPAPAASSATVTQSANDAYWAKQPAAVQRLRNIDDTGQRAMLAGQLAAEGYSIDVPVMVWGWDGSKTTQLRQGFGYTWVPSAMQAPVSAAPGISGGAIIPYDPAHPPAGSILV